MAVTNQLIIVGNITADPELRQANGADVVNLTIASTPRSFNRDTKEWEDGDPLFVRAGAWNDLAKNIAASFKKGDRVIAVGVMKSHKWKDKDSGIEREDKVLQIDEIGASVRFAQVTVNKGGKRADTNAAADDDDTPF